MSDTNQAVDPQRVARGLNFQIQEVEGLYYPCSENKGADQLAVTAQLIWAFVFAYVKIRFSHDAAHMYSINISKLKQPMLFTKLLRRFQW